MWKEFKTFIARGNVLDLAVGVIIGAAFGNITKSLTDDIIMPLIGVIFGGFDFSSHFVQLGAVPPTYHGSLHDYAALKAAGVPLFGYGQFVTVVINFVILAFIVFLIVRTANRMMTSVAKEQAAAPAESAPEPTDIQLLREIRDPLTTKPN